MQKRRLVFRKVKAHITDYQLSELTSAEFVDYAGNAFADVMAGKGAELNAVSLNDVARVKGVDNMAAKFLDRAIDAYTFFLGYEGQLKLRARR